MAWGEVTGSQPCQLLIVTRTHNNKHARGDVANHTHTHTHTSGCIVVHRCCAHHSTHSPAPPTRQQPKHAAQPHLHSVPAQRAATRRSCGPADGNTRKARAAPQAQLQQSAQAHCPGASPYIPRWLALLAWTTQLGLVPQLLQPQLRSAGHQHDRHIQHSMYRTVAKRQRLQCAAPHQD